ncbi:hypothetical protein GEV33_014233 [Tenebrio molitor]|uniref:Uncharacterized protein n=1 Tax=Tenebrio molitor TaxID=7067 RepID=A0A8J6H5P1_TENMO|nr:hypothetical protein GEV33_014233 [Tenebrio molitor]
MNFKNSLTWVNQVLDLKDRSNANEEFFQILKEDNVPDVYKADQMWDMWTTGGPKDAGYNRSKSGWFDTVCFKDWFIEILLKWKKHKDADISFCLKTVSARFYWNWKKNAQDNRRSKNIVAELNKTEYILITKTLRMQHLRLQNLKKQVKAPIIEDNFAEDSDDSINEYENTEHNASDLSNENEEANNEAYETNDWVLVKYRMRHMRTQQDAEYKNEAYATCLLLEAQLHEKVAEANPVSVEAPPVVATAPIFVQTQPQSAESKLVPIHTWGVTFNGEEKVMTVNQFLERVEELSRVRRSNPKGPRDVVGRSGKSFLFCMSVRVPWNPLAGRYGLEREEHRSCGGVRIVPSDLENPGGPGRGEASPFRRPAYDPSSVPCLGLPRNRLAARLRLRPRGCPDVLFGRHSTVSSELARTGGIRLSN